MAQTNTIHKFEPPVLLLNPSLEGETTGVLDQQQQSLKGPFEFQLEQNDTSKSIFETYDEATVQDSKTKNSFDRNNRGSQKSLEPVKPPQREELGDVRRIKIMEARKEKEIQKKFQQMSYRAEWIDNSISTIGLVPPSILKKFSLNSSQISPCFVPRNLNEELQLPKGHGEGNPQKRKKSKPKLKRNASKFQRNTAMLPAIHERHGSVSSQPQQNYSDEEGGNGQGVQSSYSKYVNAIKSRNINSQFATHEVPDQREFPDHQQNNIKKKNLLAPIDRSLVKSTIDRSLARSTIESVLAKNQLTPASSQRSFKPPSKEELAKLELMSKLQKLQGRNPVKGGLSSVNSKTSSLNRKDSRLIRQAHRVLNKNDSLKAKCNSVLNSIMLEQRRLNGAAEEQSSESADSEDERMLSEMIKEIDGDDNGQEGNKEAFENHMQEKVKVWQKNKQNEADTEGQQHTKKITKKNKA